MVRKSIALAILTVLSLSLAFPLARADGDGDGLARGRRILKGLLAGIEALRELGRSDEAVRLEAIARQVRERLANAERDRAGGSGEVPRQGAAEQDRDRIDDVMRRSMRALLEAGRHDAAHALEQGIHARELAREGRRGEEAVRVHEAAPGRERLAELLGVAAHLLAERGHERESARAAALARALLEERPAGEQREGDRTEERAREEHERRIVEQRARRAADERERAHRAVREARERAAAERREGSIEDRLERLQRALRELTGELERLRHDLDR